ncbi:hypothetical protein AJ80_07720 [Polytolypa hystricis UAMH7299]|uniref:MOSC domain-containing protein n=1 Tax=Polytolypa hystricis (strain UAMH7299) TaxID=1447883 RepID=A0A2B7XKC3_POLH7|nr:hypothetical protein AJ80_07720 [Polytolypa hystricis UAMH7299]
MLIHAPLANLIPRLNLPPHLSYLLLYTLCVLPILFLVAFELTSRRSAARQPRGCKKLGLRNFSNLDDEFEYGTDGTRKTQKKTKDQDGGKSRIKALMVYPIKSCAGVEFNIANVVGTGMMFDRQFTFAEYIADPPAAQAGAEPGTQPAGRWVTRTLRDGKYSRMTLIKPEIWVPDPSSPTYYPTAPEVLSNGVLVIKYPRPATTTSSLTKLLMALNLTPREESFSVPLFPPPNHTYPLTPLRIWRDTPAALDYSSHLPASLKQFLGINKPLALFRVDPSHLRTVMRCAPRKDVLGFQPVTGFADAYPLHILGLASVRDINERVGEAIPHLSVRRFRANIIFEGAGKYVEDDWKRVKLFPGKASRRRREGNEEEEEDEDEGVELFAACRTVRCRLPNVDPLTGVRHPAEPDKTLKSFRCIDGGDPNNACLGMQVVPSVQEFTIQVGDEIQVLETGKHFYIKQ